MNGPGATNCSFYRIEFRRSNYSCPEGSFSGNQLLDDSIGFDDRFARHRSFGLSSAFLPASCRPGMDGHLSVPGPLATLELNVVDERREFNTRPCILDSLINHLS